MAGDKHTPTPWAYDVESAAIFYNDGDVCPNIAFLNEENTSSEQCFADGELIIRAVNSHDALVDVAKHFKRTVEFYIRIDEKSGDAEGAALKRMTLSQIDAALAQAGAA